MTFLGGRTMHITMVHIHVKPDFISQFIEATKANHAASIQEPGNFRFDFMQSSDDASRFILYESYQSKEDAVAHKNTLHYQTWRETVAEWMASPREGISYQGICP